MNECADSWTCKLRLLSHDYLHSLLPADSSSTFPVYQHRTNRSIQSHRTQQFTCPTRNEMGRLTLGLANIPSGPTHQGVSLRRLGNPGTWYSAARRVRGLRVSKSGIRISAEKDRYSLQIILKFSGFHLTSDSVKFLTLPHG